MRKTCVTRVTDVDEIPWYVLIRDVAGRCVVAKKKAKDLTPGKRGNAVKGGQGDVDRIQNRDVPRLKRSIQKDAQGLGKGIRVIPK